MPPPMNPRLRWQPMEPALRRAGGRKGRPYDRRKTRQRRQGAGVTACSGVAESGPDARRTRRPDRSAPGGYVRWDEKANPPQYRVVCIRQRARGPRKGLAMKKRSSNVVRIKRTVIENKGEVVCGLDLGDRFSQVCLISQATGETVGEDRVATTPAALRAYFGQVPPMRIALEVGTHSPWVSRLLSELGHEVLVANARKVRLISQNRRKDDRIDAEYLARLARVDPKLLAPIRHRGPQAQVDLAVLRSRNALVKARAGLINHVRGVVKATGHRLPGASAESFAVTAKAALPTDLVGALAPLLEMIAGLTTTIRGYEERLSALATTAYPETALLRQVHGVGLLTSLAFVLTIEDPARFRRSRSVGAYFGLVRARQQSGDADPERHITKEGDPFMRKLLVGCAHHILGPFGKDSDLRRYGEALAAGGSKRAKKRAVVAVARKLAVLLHRLWVDRATYDPFYNLNRSARNEHVA